MLAGTGVGSGPLPESAPCSGGSSPHTSLSRAFGRGEAPGEPAGRAFSTMERARSPAATHTCFLNLNTWGSFQEFPRGHPERGRQGGNPSLNPEPSQGSGCASNRPITAPKPSGATSSPTPLGPPSSQATSTSGSPRRKRSWGSPPPSCHPTALAPGSVTTRCGACGAGRGLWAAPRGDWSAVWCLLCLWCQWPRGWSGAAWEGKACLSQRRVRHGSSSEPGTETPAMAAGPLPGPIQGLGTHDADVCYKYMCLGRR